MNNPFTPGAVIKVGEFYLAIVELNRAGEIVGRVFSTQREAIRYLKSLSVSKEELN